MKFSSRATIGLAVLLSSVFLSDVVDDNNFLYRVAPDLSVATGPHGISPSVSNGIDCYLETTSEHRKATFFKRLAVCRETLLALAEIHGERATNQRV